MRLTNGLSSARITITVCAVVMSLLVATGGALGWLYASTDTNTIGEVDFDRALAIPPLATSHVDTEGRRVFDLDLRAGHTEFRAGVSTRTWGVNGGHLGPTIRVRRGERVLLNVHNGVGEPTTLHWHGMHLPARMDGGPHQMISPGETWSPSWRVDQPAASLWYHPHPHGQTAAHVYRGLVGMFLIDDASPADRAEQAGQTGEAGQADHTKQSAQTESPSQPELPDTYGVDDIPLIVQDKKFTGDGQFDEGTGLISPTGLIGDTIMVNGTIDPYLDVTTELVRLRLLNASNARIYDFGLAENQEFTLIGSDGGLLPRSHTTRRVTLSPGERAEIVVTIRPGERTVLRSYPPRLDSGFVNDRFAGGDDSFDILQLRAADTLAESAAIPDLLTERPRLDQSDATVTREFSLRGRRINDRGMDLNRVDETVTVGDTEMWRVTNDHGIPHNFHIHDVQFQVLDHRGTDPPAYLSGWKDTVLLRPGETATLLMRFTDHTDPKFPYMFHCHLLMHEDRGMMGQFVVIDPDEADTDGQVGNGAPGGHQHGD